MSLVDDIKKFRATAAAPPAAVAVPGEAAPAAPARGARIPIDKAAEILGSSIPANKGGYRIGAKEATPQERFMQGMDKAAQYQATKAAKFNQAEETAGIERQQSAFMADIEALQSQRPDEVADWKGIAEATVRIAAQGDKDAQEFKNALLWQYGEQLRPHLDAVGGADWWDANFEPIPVEEESWKDKALKGVGAVGRYVDQWGQSGLGALTGLEAALDTGDEVSAREGLQHAAGGLASAFDITKAIPGSGGVSGLLGYDPAVIRTANGDLSADRDGDGSLNLREALGKDPEAGGRALGALDLIGTMILDPTSYVTFGSSSLAKVGMKGTEEAAFRLGLEGMGRLGDEALEVTAGRMRTMVQEMNQRIASGGWKSLEEGERSLYEALNKASIEYAAETAGAATTTRFGRDLAAARIGAIDRSGQSGLRLAGRTVLPAELRQPRATFARIVQGGDEAAGEVARYLDELAGGVPESQWGDVVDNLQDAAETLDDVRLASVRTGRFQNFLQGPLGSKLGALKPRLRLEAMAGKDTADQLGNIMSLTRGQGERAFDSVVTRLGTDLHRGEASLRSLIDEVGGEEALFSTIDKAMSDPKQFDALMETAGPRLSRALASMDSIRTETFQAALRGKGYTPAQISEMAADATKLPTDMHDINTYMPRVFTSAVRRDVDLLRQVSNLTDSGEQLLRGGADDLSEGFSKARTISDADSVITANAEARAILREAGVDVPGDLFERNPFAAMAMRSRSAFQAAADVDMLDGLMAMPLPGGIQAAYKVPGPIDGVTQKLGDFLPRRARIGDYRPLKTDSGVTYYVHNSVARELEDVRRVFGDPKVQTEAARLFDKMNNVWAMSATVGLVNPGFHMRNMIGNWFNMVLGGVRDPAVLESSRRLLRTDSKIQNMMVESGRDYATAARYLKVDPQDIKILQGARDSGVLGGSRTLDLTQATAGVTGRDVTSLTQPMSNKLSLMSPDSMLNRPGVKLGETVEGHARLAMYVDQLNKGATRNVAAEQVKKFLFDYGDLTRFESETLRRFSRFYTFTRKNTALQFYAMAHYPGRVANAQEIMQGMIQNVVDPSGDGVEGQAPDWMANPILGQVNGQGVALSVDTPLSSAADVASIATMWFQEPDPLKPGQSKLDTFVGKLDGLLSGVGVSAIDWANERMTGRDSFTGRPLNPPGTMRDGEDIGEVRDSGMFGLVEVFFPAAARAERLSAQTGFARGGRDERDLALVALNFIGGLTVQELDEDAAGAGRSTLLAELNNLLEEQRNRYGAYSETNPDGVMTLAQLRETRTIAAKDRIAEALLYSWSEGPDGELVWDESVRDERLLSVVPKDVLDAFGIAAEGHRLSSVGERPELAEGDIDGQRARDLSDMQEAIRALETWRGEPLSDEEKVTFLVASPWAPSNEMLESMGIEPYREGNRFVEGDEPTYEAQIADAQATMTSLASGLGVDPATVQAYRPRLSEFQRLLNEAAAAGIPTAQVQDYVLKANGSEGGTGSLTRNDIAFINQLLGGTNKAGVLPLELTNMPSLSSEDLRKIQVRAWEAEEEYRLFSKLYGLPAPTDEQVETYVANAIMTSGTLDDLGFADLKGAPSRKDIRSDAQRFADSLAVGGAVANRGPVG